MGNIQTFAHSLIRFCKVRLKTLYRVWNSPHTLGKTGKNGVRCSTPVPIYSHPGLAISGSQFAICDRVLVISEWPFEN